MQDLILHCTILIQNTYCDSIFYQYQKLILLLFMSIDLEIYLKFYNSSSSKIFFMPLAPMEWSSNSIGQAEPTENILLPRRPEKVSVCVCG